MDLSFRTPLIVGNWKMNGNIGESIKIVNTLKNQLPDSLVSEVVVAPPFTSLYSVSVVIQDTVLKLGGQDCFWEEEGAYTGDTSPLFLKDIGCKYVLIGHSERRIHHSETDEVVRRKVGAALNADLTPVLCLGENLEQRRENKTLEVIEKQIRKGLLDFGMHDLESFVIAYEPVWAIGTGEVAHPEQIQEVHQFIRHFIAKLYDAPTSNNVRILYGGSVKSGNVAEIVQLSQVDGVLVGGASLSPEEFLKIIQNVENVVK